MRARLRAVIHRAAWLLYRTGVIGTGAGGFPVPSGMTPTGSSGEASVIGGLCRLCSDVGVCFGAGFCFWWGVCDMVVALVKVDG